jgi:hypothetical protein
VAGVIAGLQAAPARPFPAQLGHVTASITLDTYGHLFPSEMDILGDRLELVRDVAVAGLGRTQRGPAETAWVDCRWMTRFGGGG